MGGKVRLIILVRTRLRKGVSKFVIHGELVGKCRMKECMTRGFLEIMLG